MVEGEVGERWREGGEVGEPDFKPSDLIRLSILNAVHFSDWALDGVIRCWEEFVIKICYQTFW